MLVFALCRGCNRGYPQVLLPILSPEQDSSKLVCDGCRDKKKPARKRQTAIGYVIKDSVWVEKGAE